MKNLVRLGSIVTTVLVLVFSGKNVLANGRFQVTAAHRSCIERTCSETDVIYSRDSLSSMFPTFRSHPLCRDRFIHYVESSGKNPCTEMCLHCNSTCQQLVAPNYHNGQLLAGHCLPLTEFNPCLKIQHYCKALDEAADCIINPTNYCIQNVEGGRHTACLACNTSCHLLNQSMLAAHCEREYANKWGNADYCKRKWKSCLPPLRPIISQQQLDCLLNECIELYAYSLSLLDDRVMICYREKQRQFAQNQQSSPCAAAGR